MQESEAVETSTAEADFKPDLDMSHYIPDDLQPLWEFFTPYPGLLTLLLIMVAYFFGKLFKLVVSRVLMKVASRTSTDADDHLVEYVTSPLVLTTVTLALMMVVSLYDLSQGLHDAILSILATTLLFSWLRAGLRMARVLLELLASNSHRFEIIQERTIPLFSMSIKMLLVGFGAYVFLLIWGINPTAWLASAAAIEQNHDKRGICWPEPIAPFQLALLPMNAKKSYRVREAADKLYAELIEAGVEVFYDDRDLRPGVMFNDMELIGIPHRVVIGERGLDSGALEYRRRQDTENSEIPLDGAVQAILEKLGA